MPSLYLFHLKFELYPSPAQVSVNNHASSPQPVFVPPPGSDVFKSSLPAHSTSQQTSWPVSSTFRSLNQSESTPPPLTSGTNKEAHGDALLLPERSNKLRIAPAKPLITTKPIRASNKTSARDWRYDRVSIDSIEMEARDARVGRDRKSTVNGMHTKALYLPSDTKTTEVGWGVVHLYRDTEESTYLDDEAFSRKSLDQRGTRVDDFRSEECTTLCILAVPSWMMPSDLLGFVGDQAREDVSHFRLIRTGRANKYMVLMKFRQAKKAGEWQKAYNGRLFSAAEPENCHVVFIKSVQFVSPTSDEPTFPRNSHDPFTTTTTVGTSAATSKSLSSKPFAPPPPNLQELPTCPVCLERMDETTGLLTILCQHVFHCSCLEKWRGSGCPVCRYTHSPSFTFPYPRPGAADDETEPACSTCASTTNLWICLICGNIGCGRYDSAHAYAHYEDTSHCYAMDISTQHVWDYAGDGYVHRLIQSKPDSRRPDTTSTHEARHANEAFRAEGGDSVPREKMESMATEYTYLLTSQLEGQRRYFEEQVERAVDKASQASLAADRASTRADEALAELEQAQKDRQALSETLARAERALDKSEKTKLKFETMARDMSSKWREEKLLSEGLSQRITVAESKADEAVRVAAKAKEDKAELEELNRDLTMFISGQEKVKQLQEQGEEVVDGDVSVPVPMAGKGGKGKGKGRKN